MDRAAFVRRFESKSQSATLPFDVVFSTIPHLTPRKSTYKVGEMRAGLMRGASESGSEARDGYLQQSCLPVLGGKKRNLECPSEPFVPSFGRRQN